MDFVAGCVSKYGACRKSRIEITIDQHNASKIYTSGSIITGKALVQTAQDVAFDALDVQFTGVASLELGYIQEYPTRTCHLFLRLRIPLDPNDVPNPKVFKAGETYTIPFTFVVPHSLAGSSCNCEVRSQYHLRLPPTVGHWKGDDQAPLISSIQYSITVKAMKKYRPDARPLKVLDGHRVVNFLPATIEEPPLYMAALDTRYKPSQAKNVRKALSWSKIGLLKASVSQPKCVLLSLDGRTSSTSVARITLEFVPIKVSTHPPTINSVSGKLSSVTSFCAFGLQQSPNAARGKLDTNQAYEYSNTHRIFKVRPEEVLWTAKNAITSQESSSYLDNSSKSGNIDATAHSEGAAATVKTDIRGGMPVTFAYTATIEVPFTLSVSDSIMLLPTFNSCTISRIYKLCLNLSIGPSNTRISLAVPLQVGVKTIDGERQGHIHGTEVNGEDPPSYSTEICRIYGDVPRVFRCAPVYLGPIF